MQQRVARNLLWMLAERGLQIGAGICVVAMLARGLGTEGFAHFQYAQSVVYIAASIALLCGSEVVIPRLVADQDPLAQHRLLAHAFGLRLIAGVLGYLCMCLFLAATGSAIEFWLPSLILGVAILLREPFGTVTAWMQAHTRTRPNTLISVVSLTVKLCGVAVLFALGIREVTAYAVAFTAESVTLAMLLAAFYRSRAPRMRVARNPALVRELLDSGLMFWVSFMLMMGSRRVDQLLLKPLVPLHELGTYAATMQVLDNFVLLATLLSAGIAPIYVFAQPSLALARRNILKIAAGMMLVGAAGGMLIALGAPWIIHLLYGTAFSSAVGMLRLAALASTLVFADVALTLLPICMRRPGLVVAKWGLVFLATVAIDSVAIPKFGAYGAILGYAVANLLSVLFGIVVWLRSRQAGTASVEAPA